MLKRGKFKSLIMMNWNGFFARKYDLDDLVTTLSGGNGAGKSTTMAAFITALIPDLSLLHFRNTTEAGSTSSSRDRGLHGKLKSGVCYAALECENSRGETMLFGVRLQQVAGRDKKVDLKLFSIMGLKGQEVTSLFLQQLGANKAKIVPLNDLKTICEQQGLVLKTYHSLGDYHAQMFDYGFLPKRLRTPQDRSRFYRLIEASLYGGISSTITKSLREYLLPENGSVKRAFQDMEAAILENRMTLNKIEQTRADRNFFRDLVDAAVDYVAADYVYQHNQRKELVLGLLAARSHKHKLQTQSQTLTTKVQAYALEQQQYQENYQQLLTQYEQANEYHSLLVSASRLQGQYDEALQKVEQLREELEIASLKAEDIAIAREELSDNIIGKESQIDNLRRQLSDAQAALDQQATRQVQYKQAVAKFNSFNQDYLEHYQQLTPELQTYGEQALEVEQIVALSGKFNQPLAQVNQRFYELDMAQKVSQNSGTKRKQVLQALQQVAGREVAAPQAYALAQSLVKGAILKRNLAERSEQLEREFNSLHQRREQAQASNNQVTQLQQQLGETFSSREELVEYFEVNQQAFAQVDEQRNQAKDQVAELQAQMSLINNQLNFLQQQRLPYLKAQEELQKINAKLEQPITHAPQARELLDHYLGLSNRQGLQVQNLEKQRDQLQEQIYKVEKQGMGVDQQLQYIAQDLNGVLLSEIYDDISIDDARYYAALYGPARDAIVVPSLAGIEEKLLQLKDVPSDLYLIEADFNDFNEGMFDSTLLDDNSVVVRVNEQQLRFSTIQEMTTFGRAAREKFLEQAKAELKDVLYQLNELETEYFQHKALAESLTSFIAQYFDIAFRENPEGQINQLQRQLTNCEREVTNLRRNLDSYNAQIADFTRKNGILNRLLNIFTHAVDSLEDDYQRVRNDLNQAKEAQRYIQQYAEALAVLEQDYSLLQYQVDEQVDLSTELAQVKAEQALLSNLQNLALEVVSRQEHFKYKDLGELEGDELAESLREQLKELEQVCSQEKEQLKQQAQAHEQARQQVFKFEAQLTSAQETLEQLSDDLKQTGTNVTPATVEAAKEKASKLLQEVEQVKEQSLNAKNEYQNNLQRLEMLKEQIAQAQKDFSLQRTNVADNKEKWQISQRLAQENHVATRLYHPEFLVLSNSELRSKSDRALGVLRTLISDNEYLRDALKSSEDSRRPFLKVEFFIAVYQHLRERIRQDVLATNDPIEAIEQMEIQLDMLSSKLAEREKSLGISAVDVASILDKTIQREQNRIWQLNQGLQNMTFGQVKSVRLTATCRESHALLLNALRESSSKHADLFENSELSFTESLAKLYQRINVDFEVGTRNYQTIGEELLDYRNYIDLGIEVFRGSDGWLKAESGALSTGEAIGTGMSILLMVVQSWEEESKRIRAKDLLPCRLLFLDEAARLDSRSIGTLFELCQRQQMQLIIAAPENIAPENGTTYKLVRTIDGDREYVQVIGLRGFGQAQSNNES
ncbi:chromosome partition protein MukB [Psittacicella gerlachiana]|uniref:Chromosome partition protein MukB n=1 Tax=Psittacicella gerlachiana TaxID=2028574 RepID=A0A3A1YAY8_9GAMM|nr:chromosome partition protein MukB [Psittacicella gerlachiana]RIY35473.1 chromosome partition protein MukB [Psittacicella gerlachiana]